MPIAPKADIDNLVSQIDIANFISQYVTLKTAGINSQKGLCPFHDEKSASFSVSTSTNTYHCFGCGESGNVISFAMKINGIGFVEALQILSERYHIPINWQKSSAKRDNKHEEVSRTRIIAVNQAAALYYETCFESDEAIVARDMLLKRRFTIDDCKLFHCGYAPKGWDNLVRHLSSLGYTSREMQEAGLANVSKNKNLIDRFRGRLIWPIRDTNSDVLGFGARQIYDDDPMPGKYINTSETRVYKKSKVLYGLDLARKNISLEQKCVVVEGYTDVMAMHLAGIKTAVASCGTAFGDEHIKIINRLMGSDNLLNNPIMSQGKVIFVFDGDEAGIKAAQKEYAKKADFITQVLVSLIPDNLDPCDYRIKYGNTALQNIVNNAKPIYEFIIDLIISKTDQTIESRVNSLNSIALIIADIENSITQNAYIKMASSKLMFEERDVNEALSQAKRHLQNTKIEQMRQNNFYAANNDPLTTQNIPIIKKKSINEDKDSVTQLLTLLIKYPEYIDAEKVYELDSKLFNNKKGAAIFDIICELGGADVGASLNKPQWLNLINSEAERRYSGDKLKYLIKAINHYSVLEPQVKTQKDLYAYSNTIINEILLHCLKGKIQKLLQKLKTSQNDSETQKELNNQITQLNQQLHSIKNS